MALNGNINMFASLGKLNEIDDISKAEKETDTQPVKENKTETKPAARKTQAKETAPVKLEPKTQKKAAEKGESVRKTEKSATKPQTKATEETARKIGRPAADTVTFTCRLASGQPKRLKIMAAMSDFGSVSNIIQEGVEIMTTLGEDMFREVDALAEMQGTSPAELIKKAVAEYLK